MNDGVEIKLIPSESIESIIPLLNVLSENISRQILAERLNEMCQQGYKCAGLYLNGRLIGICGLWILTKYYVGRHIEPDNVIILPEFQSKGYGKRLMAWVYGYGRSQGCIASEVNCYLPNTQAHQFWEREGYKKIAYHFQKSIKA